MKLGALVLLLAMVSAPACGGGGGSDSGVGPSPTPLAASFVADQPAPTAKMVAMREKSKANDVVEIYVTLTETTGVFGTAFEAAFDPAGATFLGFENGVAFEAGGDDPNYTVDGTSNPGRVVVGISRTGGTTTNISGSKAMLVLRFRVKTTGTFPITLQNRALYDGQVPPRPISSIQWFAGAITGV